MHLAHGAARTSGRMEPVRVRIYPVEWVHRTLGHGSCLQRGGDAKACSGGHHLQARTGSSQSLSSPLGVGYSGPSSRRPDCDLCLGGEDAHEAL